MFLHLPQPTSCNVGLVTPLEMTWFPLRREGSAPLLAFPSYTTVVPNLDSNPRPNLHSLGRMNISHSRQAVPRGLVTPLEMTWLPNKTGWVCLAVRTLVLNTFVPRIFLATSILGSIWARESKSAGNPGRPRPTEYLLFYTLRTGDTTIHFFTH